jgi:hypothetical protein
VTLPSQQRPRSNITPHPPAPNTRNRGSTNFRGIQHASFSASKSAFVTPTIHAATGLRKQVWIQKSNLNSNRNPISIYRSSRRDFYIHNTEDSRYDFRGLELYRLHRQQNSLPEANTQSECLFRDEPKIEGKEATSKTQTSKATTRNALVVFLPSSPDKTAVYTLQKTVAHKKTFSGKLRFVSLPLTAIQQILKNRTPVDGGRKRRRC